MGHQWAESDMEMKDRRQERDDIIDSDGTIGFYIIVGVLGFILFTVAAIVYLDVCKGYNVFG